MTEYYNKNKKQIIAQHMRYFKTKKGKQIKKECDERYKQKHKYKYSYTKKYRSTEKGKINNQKHLAKRRQNIEFNILFENIIDEKNIDWHHINNKDVVAIPRDLHKIYGGNNRRYHRFMCNQIVKQLYHME